MMANTLLRFDIDVVNEIDITGARRRRDGRVYNDNNGYKADKRQIEPMLQMPHLAPK